MTLWNAEGLKPIGYLVWPLRSLKVRNPFLTLTWPGDLTFGDLGLKVLHKVSNSIVSRYWKNGGAARCRFSAIREKPEGWAFFAPPPSSARVKPILACTEFPVISFLGWLLVGWLYLVLPNVSRGHRNTLNSSKWSRYQLLVSELYHNLNLKKNTIYNLIKVIGPPVWAWDPLSRPPTYHVLTFET